jgi:hypothetical protein
VPKEEKVKKKAWNSRPYRAKELVADLQLRLTEALM